VRTRTVLSAGLAAVALAAAWVTTIALASSAGQPGHPHSSAACSPTALRGQQATAVLGDMGAIMNGRICLAA